MKWVDYVKKYAKENGIEFGEAMKKAAPSFKKLKGGADPEPAEERLSGGALAESLRGGQLMGKATGAGRRKTRKTRKNHKGGQLYTFAGGPYTGSPLADGAAPFKPYDLSSMQWEGARPEAMTAGRRKTRGGRRSRRYSRRR
jgi:hypothetical protein